MFMAQSHAKSKSGSSQHKSRPGQRHQQQPQRNQRNKSSGKSQNPQRGSQNHKSGSQSQKGGGSQNQQRESQQQQPLDKQVAATIKRLQTIDPGLKQLMNDAYGYAVFPAVGKAALVIGGAYGRGEVFERGKLIGYATIG